MSAEEEGLGVGGVGPRPLHSPRERASEPALGSDPFAAEAEAEGALEAWLDALERLRRRAETAEPPDGETLHPSFAEVPVEEVRPPSAREARPRSTEVELAERPRGLERLLDTRARLHLEALAEALEGRAYDPLGLSPQALRAAFPYFYALYRFYFRVRSEGHAHVPTEGPVVLAANHAGLLPFDGAMTVVDLILHTDPPRLARSIVDRWAGTLPYLNVFFARVGQVIGTRENFAALLDAGEAVLVFPEGMSGILKPIHQRYRLQPFHVGFVEQALAARAPIVPVAILGSDDQAPILYDLKPVARRLGLPAFPITPTFPWLGPLGLLPYPVRYRIVYGEPLAVRACLRSDTAGGARVARALAREVRRRVQQLVDRNRE